MKKYEAPEANVVVFDEADFLNISTNSSGNPENANWDTDGTGNW